ncbi:unnamed protein product, partial [Rotaria sp. Silwood2]
TINDDHLSGINNILSSAVQLDSTTITSNNVVQKFVSDMHNDAIEPSKLSISKYELSFTVQP